MLNFRPIQESDIERLAPILDEHRLPVRTCDFTVGGIVMWTGWFDYQMALSPDGHTLFISGRDEADMSARAFAVPCGRMPLRESLAMLRNHCRESGIDCRLSAVPEAAMPLIAEAAPVECVRAIDGWADYLYNAEALSTLAGKKLSKKRNHVNRFMTDNPDWTVQPVTPANAPLLADFFRSLTPDVAGMSASAAYEHDKVLEVLAHPTLYGQEGIMVSAPQHGIVGFGLGEQIDDTLYFHIEKMRHDISGAGETVNNLFVRHFTERPGAPLYVNMEDDAGDVGLRHAKESYHPCALLGKYTVTLR